MATNPAGKGTKTIGINMKMVMAQELEMKVTDLSIKGIDLMHLGVNEGPLMGLILRTLLEEVKSESIPNQSEDLKKRAMEIFQENMDQNIQRNPACKNDVEANKNNAITG